jgi:hypothetical protein
VVIIDEQIHLDIIQFLLHLDIPKLSSPVHCIAFINCMVSGNERTALSNWRGRGHCCTEYFGWHRVSYVPNVSIAGNNG